MRFRKTCLPLLLLLPFVFGCATIVSKSNWPYYIDSNPAGAQVTITNKKGKEVFKGKTPTVVKLKSGSGFFGKESYYLNYSRPGYEDKTVNLECKINGWYFGNILIGGLIGMLIIDPATEPCISWMEEKAMRPSPPFRRRPNFPSRS